MAATGEDNTIQLATTGKSNGIDVLFTNKNRNIKKIGNSGNKINSTGVIDLDCTKL